MTTFDQQGHRCQMGANGVHGRFCHDMSASRLDGLRTREVQLVRVALRACFARVRNGTIRIGGESREKTR